MLKKILIATIAGAIILYVWNMLSWMVLGLHQDSLRPLPAERVLVEAMDLGVSETGAYYFPSWPADMESLSEEEQAAATERFTERHKEGPVGMLVFNKDGMDPMAPMTFVQGIVLDLVIALIVAMTLALACRTTGYLGRAAIALGYGLVVAVAGDGAYLVWMHFPADYTMAMVIDHVVGFGLMGLVTAAIVTKPKPKG